MSEFNRHFHTSFRPLDSKGQELQPLDLVIIDKLPVELYNDKGFEDLKQYEGKYGLVTYFLDEPYFYDNKNLPGWVDPGCSSVYISSHKVGLGVIDSYDFWIPSQGLTKIPPNLLIMSVFSEYPWQMRDDDGVSDHAFVVENMESYERIKVILGTPYQVLVTAHNAAMSIVTAGRGPKQIKND